MYYENDMTIRLKKEEQKNYSKAYQIHNGLLFHYAQCETLWKILESDCFYARNIRFSNDSNEYMTGRDTISKFIDQEDDLEDREKEEIQKQIMENPMMYFMVCFCEDGDLLSQWRGYAKNGVSIGMDFTDGLTHEHDIQEHFEWFCICNSKKCQDSVGASACENKYYLDKESVKFLQMPYKVQYISKTYKNGLPDDDHIRPSQVRDILKDLWMKSEEDRLGKLLKYIPFIKDDGFKEEEEYRLIFDMEFLGGSKAHSAYVRSRKMEYLDAEGLKKPYIKVEFGQPEQKLQKVRSISFGTDAGKVMDKLIQAKESQVKGPHETELLDETDISMNQKRKGIYIGAGTNQEEMMELIEKYMELVGVGIQENIKIWCAGHLPVREIVVGPGERQKEMKESLEHFKNTVYWLRYIDIRESGIPLRG